MQPQPQDSRGYFMLPQGPEGAGYYVYGTPARGAGQYAHPAMMNLLLYVERVWATLDSRKFGIGKSAWPTESPMTNTDHTRRGLKSIYDPSEKMAGDKPCIGSGLINTIRQPLRD